MILVVKQSNTFKKSVKRFPRQSKLILDDEIRKLMKNPDFGECKKGDIEI